MWTNVEDQKSETAQYNGGSLTLFQQALVYAS